MRGIEIERGQGPKARHVKARPAGCEITKIFQGLKGRPNNYAALVPPLQGGRKFVWTCSRPFRPGYHIAGSNFPA